MLDLVINKQEFWDDENQEFVYTKPCKLQLEHSLVSVSKWESKWCKPFLEKDEKTLEQTIDYIRCMTITQNVSNEVYDHLPPEVFISVKNYIDAPMTATWFKEQKKSGKKEIITTELIYYWMTVYNIPMECQKWHLNRLMTLIRICDIKNNKPEKRSKKEMLAERQALNEQRRAQNSTKG